MARLGLFFITKNFAQFSNNHLTHCAESAKIVLTIRNNPCKNMGDILEKGEENGNKNQV